LEPTDGGKIITDGPVSPLREEPDPEWDKIHSEVKQMTKSSSSNHGTIAATDPSVVSDLTDDKPNTTEVGTSTGTEESTSGTVMVVSPSASNLRASRNVTGTVNSTGIVSNTTPTTSNVPTNPTEYGLNPLTRNEAVARSRVDRRKAIANKKRKLKRQGLHVRSRPYRARKTKAVVSKAERNRFMKKLL